MSGCCDHNCSLDRLRERQRGTLRVVLCFLLLWQHRRDDINMSPVWECSRNDIASNLSVFAAAGAVWLTGAGWPDLVVASGLAWLLISSAVRVISGAATELRASA